MIIVICLAMVNWTIGLMRWAYRIRNLRRNNEWPSFWHWFWMLLSLSAGVAAFVRLAFSVEIAGLIGIWINFSLSIIALYASFRAHKL